MAVWDAGAGEGAGMFFPHSALGASIRPDRWKGAFIASAPCHQPPLLLPGSRCYSLYRLLQQRWRFTEKPLQCCFHNTGVPSEFGVPSGFGVCTQWPGRVHFGCMGRQGAVEAGDACARDVDKKPPARHQGSNAVGLAGSLSNWGEPSGCWKPSNVRLSALTSQ